ncbi:MAG TPA: hypothetical protein VGS28_04520 [Candidatus Saccharimonadales bacterium]|nr:hypothetical protein [Candidatus Saccharimonadales bacterium]
MTRRSQIKRLYLDLDRTLYMTDRALKLVAEECEKLWRDKGITAQRLIQEAPRYYSSEDPNALRTHEFFRQMLAYGVDLRTEGGRLRDSLSKYDLLFPDARDLLDYVDTLNDLEVKIITFGEEDFQKFKLSLLPRLAKYPVIITMGEKATYIRRHEKKTPSLIVDDKTNPSLPAWCEGVLLDRTGNTSSKDLDQESGELVVNGLDAIKSLITSTRSVDLI